VQDAAETILRSVLGWLEVADALSVDEIVLADAHIGKVDEIRALLESCLRDPLARLQAAVRLGPKFVCHASGSGPDEHWHEFTYTSGSRSVVLKMMCSDLLSLQVDTVVYGASPLLLLQGGLARYIAKNAGPAFMEEVESARLDVRRGKLSPGDAIITGSGDLKTLGIFRVIHAVIPRFQATESSQAMEKKALDAMRLAVKKVLDTAESCRESRSVAMPLMGSGNFGWPEDRAAEAIVGSVMEWLESGGGAAASVDKIVLFDAQPAKVAALVDAFREALRLPVEGLRNRLLE
jgi:O-acetyl-ADP-ribose deacetylase (regulator of RNase III)